MEIAYSCKNSISYKEQTYTMRHKRCEIFWLCYKSKRSQAPQANRLNPLQYRLPEVAKAYQAFSSIIAMRLITSIGFLKKCLAPRFNALSA